MRLRVVELYCGIGGCSAALAPALAARVAEVVLAVDLNPNAVVVYRHNFPRHPCRAAAVESISAEELAALDADLWWLSPPCQPFTRRGKGRDVDDPRAATFLAMINRLAALRPPWVALENVPGFVGSRVHRRLLDTLEGAGYGPPIERILCPSAFGLPNRRERYYLVASRHELAPIDEPSGSTTAPRFRLSNFLDSETTSGADPALRVEPALLRRYEGALDLVRRDDPVARTACFTSAYGRSPVRSGSYLVLGEDSESAVRRFSPAEILRLLGFPADFRLPEELEPRRGWPLVGNSLSLPPVRAMLSAVPGLAESLVGHPVAPGAPVAPVVSELRA